MPNKPYKVFTKRLANLLCQQGFKIVGTEINNRKPWLYVYLFENSEALQASVEEFLSEEGRKDE